MKNVPKPWTPIMANECDGRIETTVFGRKNVSGKRSFLEEMTSDGESLLSAPIRVVGTEDGRDFVFENYTSLLMDEVNECYSDIVSSAESEQFVLNVTMKTEFDGFIDTALTIVPRGRSVAQIFGLENLKPYDYRLTRLWLEIPLSAECAKYCQFFPRPAGMDVLDAGGEITESKNYNFKEQILITNDNVGFMISFESEANFTPYGNESEFEIIKEDGGVTLRIRLFDEEPEHWQKKEGRRWDLLPVTFRFGIMTTPVKPVESALTVEKAVHIDCFKKIKEDYETFLAAPFDTEDISVYDRLSRLGVNTLYLHEKWNDLQNSPILTRKTAKRLETITKECHARGIKVIPYFGYEISSLAPYYRDMLPRVGVVNEGMSRWFRQPAQRDSKACQNSEWQDFHREGVLKLMDRYGFDGIYLDGTAYLWACKNESHGCGFRTPDGELHVSYPVFAVRENMKKLYYDVVEKRGGIINCHAGSAFNMPALSFATSLWDGEVFQSQFINGKISRLPDGYFKCLYTGRNLGLPIYMLCYLNPPEWSFDMALAVSLPFGILPKVNDVGDPLEKISKIWKIYEDFGVDTAEFIPFYALDTSSSSISDKRIKKSVYKKDDRELLILALTDKEVASSFTLKSKKPRIKDALTGEMLSGCGETKIELSGFDFRIIEIY